MNNIARVMLSLLALAGLLFSAFGEPPAGTPADSSTAAKDKAAPPPQPQGLVLTPKVTTYDFDAIPKDPLASALLSASLPGTGQIYNKEYLRGIITGVVFYGSFFSIQYLLTKWDELNLDTFYIREAYDSTKVHMAVAPKPEDEQVGLATGDKVWLIATLTLVAASYVFGVVDAYYGAKRYNKKLFEGQQRLKLGLMVDPAVKKFGVCAKYQF